MKCPHCHENIGGPIVGPKRLKCPECGEDLVQLDLIFKQEELTVFNDIIDRAMHEPEAYEALRQDPRGVLEEAGISQETISRLMKAMEEVNVPVVAASMVDPESWPEIEFPQEPPDQMGGVAT